MNADETWKGKMKATVALKTKEVEVTEKDFLKGLEMAERIVSNIL